MAKIYINSQNHLLFKCTAPLSSWEYVETCLRRNTKHTDLLTNNKYLMKQKKQEHIKQNMNKNILYPILTSLNNNWLDPTMTGFTWNTQKDNYVTLHCGWLHRTNRTIFTLRSCQRIPIHLEIYKTNWNGYKTHYKPEHTNARTLPQTSTYRRNRI
jgi:hypothetical protein